MQLVAEGKVAIPANKNHKCLDPNGIGSMLKTKINVNLGTSRDCKDLDMELQKVNDAVKMGAEMCIRDSLMTIPKFPSFAVFMIGVAIALPVNYPSSSDQNERIKAHAPAL